MFILANGLCTGFIKNSKNNGNIITSNGNWAKEASHPSITVEQVKYDVWGTKQLQENNKKNQRHHEGT